MASKWLAQTPLPLPLHTLETLDSNVGFQRRSPSRKRLTAQLSLTFRPHIKVGIASYHVTHSWAQNFKQFSRGEELSQSRLSPLFYWAETSWRLWEDLGKDPGAQIYVIHGPQDGFCSPGVRGTQRLVRPSPWYIAPHKQNPKEMTWEGPSATSFRSGGWCISVAGISTFTSR